MINSIKINNSNTIINLIDKNIEEIKSDAIIIWVNKDLKSGPLFNQLNRKAGPQLYNAMLTYNVNIDLNDCDCFTTIPGLLDCNIVLHSILPNNYLRYSNSFFNIQRTISEYKKDNLCRSIVLYLPNDNFNSIFIDNIIKFLTNIELEEVNICVKQENMNNLIELLNKYKKIYSLKEKIEFIIDNLLNKIGKFSLKMKKIKNRK